MLFLLKKFKPTGCISFGVGGCVSQGFNLTKKVTL